MNLRIVALLQLVLRVVAQSASSSDGDFTSFMTLPGVRALKYEVYYQNRERVSPGYWFVAPYGKIDPEPPSQKYKPYQIGPYIYDGDGACLHLLNPYVPPMLIWAGSPMFDNRNVFDFKVVHSIGNRPHLSLVWQLAFDKSDSGHGVVLDNAYNIKQKIPMPREFGAFDIHEFNILDDGITAVTTNYREHEILLDTLDRPGEQTAVLSGGFAQLDLTTEKVTASWDGIDKIGLDESVIVNKEYPAMGPPGWDYVHINSVDKNRDGDYIISYRFTNTIYMVSGMDGTIMWRLGGKYSDFEHDFTFSKQHDVKFVESNATHHVISFLNNASDEESNDEDVSSALFVELDASASPKTARVIRRLNRPDGGLTRLRGNTQLLSNNNVFVGWSESGYLSEFSPEGAVLLTARFVSSRYSTYRAYKFEFTGRPSTPPDLIASVWGTDKTDLSTTFYVSWNGATDIAAWNFYARAAKNGHPVLVGNASKTSFETMFIARGYLDWVTAEAVDREGRVLGMSRLQRSKVPNNWGAAGFKGDLKKLTPDDPQAPKPGSNKQTAVHEEAHGSNGSTAPHPVDPEMEEITQLAHETYNLVRNISNIFVLIVAGCIICGIAVSIYLLICRWKKPTYRHVPTDDIPEEEIRLRSVE
ncbi:ASST-domain-containing protein [Aspergillus coremiiformis]|uniref:ASST-domain-containing protein n=1 Tax=Aspergillus coremiiformis TaxID=138285 RepID=A0A5N6YXR2_9EURO|nr:ASST-domain-containing protein [Aspergillus coremiiformis]